MKDQPSESYIQWAHQYFVRCSNLNGGASAVATTWIRSFGAAAGQVQNYLESGHAMVETLPAALVHDLRTLAQASYARFPVGDARRALVVTWSGLAHLYGGADGSASREMDRLETLADWAQALDALQYSGFPGLRQMVLGYQAERRRLDLTKLRHDRHNFKYVGMILDLLKQYEPRTRPTHASVAEKRRGVDNRKPTVCQPVRSDAARDRRNVRLAEPSTERLAIELHGNWRDHWSNTLPEVA